MYQFNYHAPQSLGDALALLQSAEDPKLLAGGMTMIPTLKQRLAQPSDIIDLKKIPGLSGVTEEAGGVRIGAMTRHVDVQRSELVRRVAPAMAELAGTIGDPQVRNRGTIAGSIANADPAADYPAGVLGLAATIRTNQRDIAADDFFTGMFETALEPNEIIGSVFVPASPRARYVKFRNPISGYAVVGVLVWAPADGSVRVAVTGAGPNAYRWAEAEQALTARLSPDAIAGLDVDPGELNGDMHASAEYRAHLVKVITRRAVAGLPAG